MIPSEDSLRERLAVVAGDRDLGFFSSANLEEILPVCELPLGCLSNEKKLLPPPGLLQIYIARYVLCYLATKTPIFLVNHT